MCIIVLATAAEPVLEVLVVLVAFRSFFACDVSFLAGLRVQAQSAGRILGHAGCTAVADEIALVEQFDKGVFAVAGYRARVADACWCMDLSIAGGRRTARKASV